MFVLRASSIQSPLLMKVSAGGQVVEARISPPAQLPTGGGARWNSVKSRLWSNRKSGAAAGKMVDVDELVELSKLPAEAACQKLGSTPLGLTSDAAAQRLNTYGLNLVTRERRPTIPEEIWNRSKIRSMLCSSRSLWCRISWETSAPPP